MKNKRVWNVLFVLFLCVAWFAIGWVANARFSSPETAIIKSVYHQVQNESIFNDLTAAELSYAAIRGMLRDINDPFAEFIEPEAAQDLIDAFTGNTGVVGLYAENVDEKVVVLEVYPDGPADLAGVEPGDVILSIDEVVLDKDSDSSETGLLIRGAPDTSVVLDLLRDGETFDITIIRQQKRFASSRLLPGRIGYIYLNGFNETATQEMEEALRTVLEEEPIGLLLDLRNNEGGDMDSAQDILSFFIGDGLLFSAELTQGRTVEFFAEGNPVAADIPIVVLMDNSTYSAGETFAAAIAELGRGTTIGSNSYGKGLIQASIPMADGTILQMTVAKWYSSNGEWYQDRGVPPQIEIYDDPATEEDELVQKGIELLLAAP